MRNVTVFHQLHRGFTLALLSAGLAAGAATAAEPGDPARWYKPDTSHKERVATSRKEAYAAYKEAMDECKRVSSGERAACVAEAKATLKRDLDYAQRQPEPVASRAEPEDDAALRRQVALLLVDELECATN